MASAPSGTDTNVVGQSGSALPKAPSQPGPSRQTHIRFPTEADSPSSRAHGLPGFSGTGLRSLDSSPGGQRAGPASGSSLDVDIFERRRVRSALASDSLRPLGSYSRAQYLSPSSQSRTTGKRSVSHSLHGSTPSYTKGTSSIGSSPLSAGVLLPSEEDNSGDDPNILADLHKALQFKPHVEQHLKEAKSLTDFSPSSLPSTSSPSSNASPVPFTTKTHLPRSEPNTPIKAEFIDFSPAAGQSSLHPVPKSSDDGATLDWSGSATDEEKNERKWTMSMSIPRRSSKDKNAPLSRKALVEKQETSYSEKLARIKDKANELTKRKAEITKDQLQRRYAAFNDTYNSSSSHLNIAEVARWYDKQESTVKSDIAESEPMPWLRHLHHKRGHQHLSPSPWHLSALIVDQYVKAHSDTEFMLSPTPSGGDDVSDAGSSASAARLRPVSKATSFVSLDAALARKSDEMISFEPMVQPRRDSAGTDSRVSVDTQLKRWRQSLLNRVDLEASSESSARSRRRTVSVDQRFAQTGQSSSVGSRSPFHGLEVKKRSHPTPLNSDDGQSSAADSMAERLNENKKTEDKQGKRSSHEKKRSRFRLSLDIRSAQLSQDEGRRTPPLSITDLRTDANQPNKSQSLPIGKHRPATKSADAFEHFSSSNNHLGSPILLNSARRADQKKNQSLSLPPAYHTPRARRARPDTRTETQNHALQVEYNRKKELLDALLARNQRMRSLLQIAARSITDYDESQSTMSEKLGLSYSRLPPDVLVALKHDPSVSTSHLRHLKGWHAVEDIHYRREHQKEVLESFTASLPDMVTPLSLPKDGIYENAIANLTNLVERLHNQRTTVLSHVRQTHELLSKVKMMRDELKPEFDEASKHTSVNYPELVRLETLLDELVNETHHLWKFAEASLSFLLASVAPLMRAFGRPIWDELYDFLIIPLYRNGFSGEDHWYPVTFPRRKFAHWLRLLLFATCAPFLLSQGTRAFVALLTHGYVLRIPSFIPAFVVYIMFSGVMCTFASLLFGLLVAVLCELFIILWWTLWLLHIVR